jgi:hypothetical protein
VGGSTRTASSIARSLEDHVSTIWRQRAWRLSRRRFHPAIRGSDRAGRCSARRAHRRDRWSELDARRTRSGALDHDRCRTHPITLSVPASPVVWDVLAGFDRPRGRGRRTSTTPAGSTIHDDDGEMISPGTTRASRPDGAGRDESRCGNHLPASPMSIARVAARGEVRRQRVAPASPTRQTGEPTVVTLTTQGRLRTPTATATHRPYRRSPPRRRLRRDARRPRRPPGLPRRVPSSRKCHG